MRYLIKHTFYACVFLIIGISIGIVLEKVRVNNARQSMSNYHTGVIAIADSVSAVPPNYYQQTIDSLQAANVDLQNQVNFYEDK